MTAEPAPVAAPPPRRRRRGWRVLLLLLAVYLGALAFGMPPSVPFDVVITAWPVADVEPSLRAPADGPHLVVLQHGLWRSPWSMWRLERALHAAGYEVLNPGYRSTSERIEQASARLHDAIELWVREHGAPRSLAFVGHSMGGVVIADYLRRPDARAPTRCVSIATPHRGAVLCDLRKHWWPFPLLMGTAAAMQLSTGDPLHALPIPFGERSGAIRGDLGQGNASIPGNDDGTVGVDEARFDGIAAVLTLPLSHTAIAGADATIRGMLQFLRDGSFAN